MKGVGFIIILLNCFKIQAQVFTLGPRVGFDFSSINFDSRFQVADTTFRLVSEDAKLGLNGGLFFRFKTKKIYIQPELVVTQLRTTFRMNSSFDTIGETKEIQYLKYDFPVLVGVKLGKTFRLNAGIVGSYVFSSFIKNVKSSFKYSPSLSDSKTQFNYQIGFGFDIRKNVTIDFKYEGNLGTHNSNLGIGASSFPFQTRLNNFQLNFGFALIPFKKQ